MPETGSEERVRHRRADRLNPLEISYQPSEDSTPPPETPPAVREPDTAPPTDTVERPVAPPPQPVRKKKRRRKMPRWLTAAIITALCLCLTVFTANALMNAYLITRQRAREAAHERLLKNHPLQYRAWIEQYAAENNLQPALVAAIILNESSYNSRAVSNVGARGLMQLMEDTAEWIDGKLKVENYSFDAMWDPETNIRFGCWYLGYLSRQFGGDPVCVAAAYHAGQGTVSGWLQSYSDDGRTLSVNSLPEGPTKIYAGRVTDAYAIYDKIYWNAFNPSEGSADAVPVSGRLLPSTGLER